MQQSAGQLDPTWLGVAVTVTLALILFTIWIHRTLHSALDQQQLQIQQARLEARDIVNNQIQVLARAHDETIQSLAQQLGAQLDLQRSKVAALEAQLAQMEHRAQNRSQELEQKIVTGLTTANDNLARAIEEQKVRETENGQLVQSLFEQLENKLLQLHTSDGKKQQQQLQLLSDNVADLRVALYTMKAQVNQHTEELQILNEKIAK